MQKLLASFERLASHRGCRPSGLGGPLPQLYVSHLRRRSCHHRFALRELHFSRLLLLQARSLRRQLCSLLGHWRWMISFLFMVLHVMAVKVSSLGSATLTIVLVESGLACWAFVASRMTVFKVLALRRAFCLRPCCRQSEWLPHGGQHRAR